MVGPARVKGLSQEDARKISMEELARVGLQDKAEPLSRPALRGTETTRGHRPGAGYGSQGYAL